ncbi:MAG: 2-C-methyl-D-erythritol 2,4-cyclodiphosphate synthase [Deltaproteobacteria bacterium RBG_16_54_11]|nr:MAG: 2-C-methyl-D-erythritol 2,4-cyclodiphosphate synthase [Deltaproteobacteria bacterium RBG_16_54_11]
MVEKAQPEYRIGMGYDVHPFAENRPLILGGITIPYHQGLAGHSDADCLAHAICDALLGAISEGDLGKHFPDSDPRYKDAESLLLLKKVAAMVERKGFRITNIDATIVAQAPQLAPHRAQMEEAIATAVKVEHARVNVKATTTEGLGFIGRGEGIAAYAIALLEGR